VVHTPPPPPRVLRWLTRTGYFGWAGGHWGTFHWARADGYGPPQLDNSLYGGRNAALHVPRRLRTVFSARYLPTGTACRSALHLHTFHHAPTRCKRLLPPARLPTPQRAATPLNCARQYAALAWRTLPGAPPLPFPAQLCACPSTCTARTTRRHTACHALPTAHARAARPSLPARTPHACPAGATRPTITRAPPTRRPSPGTPSPPHHYARLPTPHTSDARTAPPHVTPPPCPTLTDADGQRWRTL